MKRVLDAVEIARAIAKVYGLIGDITFNWDRHNGITATIDDNVETYKGKEKMQEF